MGPSSLTDIQQADSTEETVELEDRLVVTQMILKVYDQNKMLDFHGEDCYQGRARCHN